MDIINRFKNWLGTRRFYLLLGMFASTGILSFALFFWDVPEKIAAQNALALASLAGAAWLIMGRFDSEIRRTWTAILLPAFGLVVLGIVIVQQYQLAFLGAAFGWIIVGLLLFGKTQAPMQYRAAIKAMRKNDFKQAVSLMDDLIKLESDTPQHYRFRAELLRLSDKLGRARNDYQKMAKISHDKGDIAQEAVAYNGLAEIELQAGNYQTALEAAQKAYELAPQEWVAAYNLGMIQDRMKASEQVIQSLEQALAAKVPDARHRLLIYFYMLRAYSRLKETAKAQDTLQKLQRESKGLKEWELILQDEQATVLRDVLGADIQLASQLINGTADFTLLAKVQ